MRVILIDEKNDVKIKVVKRAVASIKGKTEDLEDDQDETSTEKDK